MSDSIGFVHLAYGDSAQRRTAQTWIVTDVQSQRAICVIDIRKIWINDSGGSATIATARSRRVAGSLVVEQIDRLRLVEVVRLATPRLRGLQRTNMQCGLNP